MRATIVIDLADHDAVAHDLALTRARAGEIVAERVPLGEWGGGLGGGICDVMSLRPSWSGGPKIWEVKISRADLLGDLRREKYKRYLRYCAMFYFAIPSGLLSAPEIRDRELIPDFAGVAVLGGKGWSVRRAARYRRREGWDREALRALLLAQHPAPWRNGTRRQRLAAIQAEFDKLPTAAPKSVAALIRERRELVADLKGAETRLRLAVEYAAQAGIEMPAWYGER